MTDTLNEQHRRRQHEPNIHTMALKRVARQFPEVYFRFARASEEPRYSSAVVTTAIFYKTGPEFAVFKSGASGWIRLPDCQDDGLLKKRFIEHGTSLDREELDRIGRLRVGKDTLVCNRGFKVSRLKLTTREVPMERGLLHNGRTSKLSTRIAHAGTPEAHEVVEFSDIYAPTVGTWSMLGLEQPFSVILDLLPDHALLTLHVTLEAGPSGGDVVRAGVHVASLTLHAQWQHGKRRREVSLLLGTETTLHNPNRFGWASVNGIR